MGSLDALELVKRVFDQVSEHVAKPDRFLNTWCHYELVADLLHDLTVSSSIRFTGLTEHLKVLYSFVQLGLLNICVCCSALVELPLCLLHSSKCFFVVSILVDFYLGACIVEICERVECFRF